MTTSLQHFSPSDIALVLSAAAKAPLSRFTLQLLHAPRPTAAAAAAAAEVQPKEGVPPQQQRETEEMKLLSGFDSSNSDLHQNAEHPSLFVSLLRAFVTQLPHASVNDSVRVFFAVSVVYNHLIRDSVASLPQQTRPAALPSLPCSQTESLAADDACAVAAAWADSLEPLTLLARHLRGCVSAASPRATLRVLAGAVRLWPLLRNEAQESRLSLHASVAAALSDRGGSEGPPQTAGEGGGLSLDRGKPHCACSEVLSACKAGRDGGQCSNEEKVQKETMKKQQEAACDNALRELLAATIPALSGSSADLSLGDCVSLLELLWPLVVSPNFSLPFCWVEGLLFHLAAQAHSLSPSSLLALAAFAELCLARDGGEGSKELYIHRTQKERQVQNEVVADLLRRRIRQEIERKDPELTSDGSKTNVSYALCLPVNVSQEKRLFRCLLEASEKTPLPQLLISSSS
ncbi:hypothetical protein Emed_003257 [Eimeria media]